MSKIEELTLRYMKDLQLASSKQKYGFFSIPPSVYAGCTTFQQKTGNFISYTVKKDQNGKVKTQERNILSGICASGVLKKSYFSYPEYKTGDLYMDPGKVDRTKRLVQSQKFKDKQVFKPASLNKTLASASYEYVPLKEQSKTPKMYRNEYNKVKTQNPNIKTNPQSKINYKSSTQLKYISEPYESVRLQIRKQLVKDVLKRGENPFKPSSPVKEYFATNKQLVHLANIPQKKERPINIEIHRHDSNFKPAGNHFKDGIFSYPKYIPNPQNTNSKKNQTAREKNVSECKKQPFKLIKQEKNSKPSPSISLSKMNVMMCLR